MRLSQTVGCLSIFAGVIGLQALGCAQSPENIDPSSVSPGAKGVLRGNLSVRAEDLVVLSREFLPVLKVRPPKLRQSTLLSPDSRWIARVEQLHRGLESSTYGVYVRDTSQENEITVAKVTNLSALAWSPDSSKIVFCEGLIVRVSDRDGHGGGQVVYIGPGGPYPGACADLEWSRDGKRLSFIQIPNVYRDDVGQPLQVTITFGYTIDGQPTEHRP